MRLNSLVVVSAVVASLTLRATAGPATLEAPESPSAPASPSPPAPPVDWEQVTLFGDVGETFGLVWKSSYTQLLHTDTLAVLSLGTAATWITDHNDEHWLATLRGTDSLQTGLMDAIGDEAALALAATPLVTWMIANWTEDEKLRSYSVETTSAIMLTYVETLLITHAIPTHKRPRDEEGDEATSFFDTAFRGRYSFPSGHLIGPFIVTLKTWDYYGWKAAAFPAGVTIVSVINRIADGSHYPSDIVAAGVLSLSAHLATRHQARERDGGFHWSVGPVAGGGLMFTGGFEF